MNSSMMRLLDYVENNEEKIEFMPGRFACMARDGVDPAKYVSK